MRLAGKVALITGAARGQGAEEARLFAAEGARVMLTDMDAAGAKVAEGIGADARFMRHDVGEERDWADVVSATVAAFGRLDILINNAGVYRPAPLAETDRALWDLHYRVNQLGVFLGMQAVIAPMREGGGGSIVNVSSNAGMRNVPGMFAYGTSKWAVRGMSKLAASELAPLGIRVNSIHPGIIDTPMLGENDAARMALYESMIPMKRMGKPREVAEVALFLASDEAGYVTGAELTVDGGIG